jgi:hypothetical protein
LRYYTPQKGDYPPEAEAQSKTEEKKRDREINRRNNTTSSLLKHPGTKNHDGRKDEDVVIP